MRRPADPGRTRRRRLRQCHRGRDPPQLSTPGATASVSSRCGNATDLALFDFDGTITRSETFGAFIRHAAPPARVAIGRVVLAPLVLGYRLGLLPARLVRAVVVRFAFAGMAEQQLHRAAQHFCDGPLATMIRPEALARIRWHRSRGDTVVVVSGAFDVYLARWCRAQRLDCLCSALDVVDGRLSGRYMDAQCVGAEKVRRIREHYNLANYREVYAYGDTDEDRAMLAMADRRVYRWQPQDDARGRGVARGRARRSGRPARR